MIELTLADATAEDVSLHLQERITKGEHTASVPELLKGRVTLGVPAVVRLSAALVKDDGVTAEFRRQLKDDAFYFVQLACTFHRNERTPFAEAWLRVNLRPESSAPSPGAIAWSMRPERVEDTQEITNSVELSSQFKLMPISQKLKMGDKVKTAVRRVQVAANGLMESTPYWHFRRIDASELEGAMQMGLVVKAPRSVPVSANIELRAMVVHHLLGLIPYQAAIFTDRQSLQFPRTARG
jgi:hypothetical protein